MTIIKLLLFLTLLCTPILAANFGNGSDGVCNLNTTIDTDTKSTYNCTSVAISSLVVTGSSPLIIRSLSSITITGIISLNGGVGGVGQSLTSSTIGTAGPGGYSGGSCLNGIVAGNNGLSGGNHGEGLGGTLASNAGITDSIGAGGGGGRFGDFVLPTAGDNGADDFGGVIAGGSAGISSYAPESGFEVTFLGGSGGGAGSAGVDNGSGNSHSGGAGGGGGGAIKLVSKNDITIELAGGISTNGGNGGAGSSTFSGGGGGGSGGAIFIQAEGAIKINGSVSALGGSGGIGGFTPQNSGGNGGSGRIRYDDSDGIITGTGTTNPTAVINTIQTSVSSASYDSSIACGAIGLAEKDKAIYSFLSIFLLLLVGNIISKKSCYI